MSGARSQRIYKQIAHERAPGKQLTDDLEGYRSAKVGKYRVIFNLITEGVLWVDFVGHRHSVYKDARRLLDRRRHAAGSPR